MSMNTKGRSTVDHRRKAEIDHTVFSIFTRSDAESLIPISVVFDYNNPKKLNNTIYGQDLGYSTYNPEKCYTCKESRAMCQGHLGAIFLPVPIPHPLYIKQIRNLLNISCHNCFQSLLKPAELESFSRLPIDGRLDAIYLEIERQVTAGSLKCENIECKSNSLVAADKKGNFYYQEYIKKKKVRHMDGANLDPSKVYDLLNVLSNNTELMELLGFSQVRPIDLLLHYIIVIPPCVRESNSGSDGGRSNMDYIGQVYQDIIKKTLEYGSIPDKSEKQSEWIEKMFFTYSHLINNADLAYKKSKSPLLGIVQLLKGKKGYIRGNGMGKRTDFSFRTVITPNPTISIGEIGLPISIANDESVPEDMCRYNLEYYKKKLKAQNEGAPKDITKWSPANDIGNPRRILDKTKWEIYEKLSYGDRITRRLVDGDIAFIGRNPTLHKHGVMGSKIKKVREDTIQLNPATVTPYNADFDGDEMNGQVPQEYLARAEARYVSNLRRLIENPETGQNIIGLVMDNITGGFNLTNVLYEEPRAISKEIFDRAVGIMSYKGDLLTLDHRLEKHGVEKYTTRGLFSALLPSTFTYTVGGNKIIIDGVFFYTALKKEHIGRSKHSIIKKIDFLYGWDRASTFINDASLLISYWNSTVQFSVGISDCRIDDQRLVDLKTRDNSHVKFAAMTLQVETDSKIEQDRLEGETNAILNRTAALGEEVNKILPPSNPIKQMVISGAKGDFFNISQIIAQVGQQFLEGKRMQFTLTDRTRASVFYPPNSKDPEARGYVKEAFADGLPPAQLYFHLMATREGLVDTATKTAEVGDLHHRISKALENYMVEYDGTVRDRFGNILQFIYGDDGLDPAHKMFYGSNDKEFGFFADLESLAEKVNSECYLEEA